MVNTVKIPNSPTQKGRLYQSDTDLPDPTGVCTDQSRPYRPGERDDRPDPKECTSVFPRGTVLVFVENILGYAGSTPRGGDTRGLGTYRRSILKTTNYLTVPDKGGTVVFHKDKISNGEYHGP